MAYYFSLVVCVLLLAGCIQTSSEPEIVSTRIVEAPRPPEKFDLQAGAATYAQWCIQCHGAAGQGDGETAAAFTCQLPDFTERPASVTLLDWYEVVENGKGSAESGCLMPRWSERLNQEQMWDVSAYAFSLVYDPALVQTGQNLLEDNTTGETPFDFTNPRWQADTSDALILASLNGIDGYALANLSDQEKQAVLVYIRSLNYETFPVEIAVVQPVTTQEPTDLNVTPLPIGTDEPIEGTFTLTGQVINGTANATLPSELTLRLRIVGLNADNQPEEIYTAETAMNPDGTSVKV